MSIALFAEGVGSLLLPCTWVLAIPTMAMVATGSGRGRVVASSAAGLVGGSMLRAAGEGVLPPASTVPAGIFMALSFVAVRADRWAPVAAFGSAWLAVALWQPCVGPNLGAVLDTGIDQPGRAAIAMVPFAAGAALTIPATALSVALLTDPARRRAASVAMGLGSLIGVAVALGAHDRLIAHLAVWSVSLTT